MTPFARGGFARRAYNRGFDHGCARTRRTRRSRGRHAAGPRILGRRLDRHGQHDRLRRVPAAGVAGGLSRASLAGWVVSAAGAVMLALVFARLARQTAGHRRDLRLHAGGVWRFRRVPGRVGLLAFDCQHARRACRRVRRLSRSVRSGDRAHAGGRGALAIVTIWARDRYQRRRRRSWPGGADRRRRR